MKAKSVHFVMIPEQDPNALDEDIQRAVEHMQVVVELGRTCRERKGVLNKMPLKSMTVLAKEDGHTASLKRLQAYVEEELNVIEIKYGQADFDSKIVLSATLNFKTLGKKIGKDMKVVQDAVRQLGTRELSDFSAAGTITLCGHEITSEDMSITRSIQGLDDPNLSANMNSEFIVILDFAPDDDLCQMAVCRDITARVQKLRKEAKLRPEDPTDMWVSAQGQGEKSKLQDALEAKAAYIDKLLRRRLWRDALKQEHLLVVTEEEFSIGNEKLKVCITSRGVYFNEPELGKLTNENEDAQEILKQFLQTFRVETLAELSQGESLEANYAGKTFNLCRGTHFSLGPEEAAWLA